MSARWAVAEAVHPAVQVCCFIRLFSPKAHYGPHYACMRVAADRYAVDRLKLVCQSILRKNIDVETVSATMALAYQHNCDRLKDICLEFITSSSSVMDSVVETQGYKNLKTTCPSALVDLFEKSRKLHKA